jgi:hypothetical protein
MQEMDKMQSDMNQDAMRKMDAMKTNTMRYTHCVDAMRLKGFCAHCGKEFEKNTTWQRFCTKVCRVESWEKKRGKKLYIKKE